MVLTIGWCNINDLEKWKEFLKTFEIDFKTVQYNTRYYIQTDYGPLIYFDSEFKFKGMANGD